MKKILQSIKTYKRTPKALWHNDDEHELKSKKYENKNLLKPKTSRQKHDLTNPLEPIYLNGNSKHRDDSLPKIISSKSSSVDQSAEFVSHTSSMTDVLADKKSETCKPQVSVKAKNQLENHKKNEMKHQIKIEGELERKRRRCQGGENTILVISEGNKHCSEPIDSDVELRSNSQIYSFQTDCTDNKDCYMTAQSQESIVSSPLLDEIPSSSPCHSPLQLEKDSFVTNEIPTVQYNSPDLDIPSSLQESQVDRTIANTQWWEEEALHENEKGNESIISYESANGESVISDTDSEIELVSDSATETPDSSPTKLTQSYFRKLLSDSLIESLPLPPQRKLEYVGLFKDEDSETQDE